MTASPTRGVTLRIRPPLGRADLPGLFARACALLDEQGVELIVCEVSEVAGDAVAVDALARLALAARRRGCAVRLSGARAELLSLVALLGLADVLGE
jgi:ABC-type transporter Mla MlaB component